jgi:FAD/FMN-containing dehydrogenase
LSVIEDIRTLDGGHVALDDGATQTLASAIRGEIVRPGDATYDDVRRVWNGMIDKRPALIVRCQGTTDVAAAVNFARERQLLVSVRGNGHNVAGNAISDGGLMIDLMPMKGIHVDPAKRTARVQPGATWNDLDRETQTFGLATPGGEVSTTGVSGYTLSGGMGLLHRKWGLSCDNLLSVEIVTADGGVRQVNELEHPDLFWAVRGGGGNFGVVTWLEYQLHRLGPEVYSAGAIYSIDDAPSILRQWRDFTLQASNEVTTQALFWSMPPLPDLPEELHFTPIVMLAGLYAGSADDGERALSPLSRFATPVVDLGGRTTYLESQTGFDDFFPPGLNYYWKSLFLDEVTDEVLDQLVTLTREKPSSQAIMVIRHLGGAISQTPEDATAFGNRHAQYNLSLDTTWDDPADNERMVAWTRQTWSRLHEQTGGGVYLNFAGVGEDVATLARAGYRGNYARLREIKRRYDPANLFRGNINIRP